MKLNHYVQSKFNHNVMEFSYLQRRSAKLHRATSLQLHHCSSPDLFQHCFTSSISWMVLPHSSRKYVMTWLSIIYFKGTLSWVPAISQDWFQTLRFFCHLWTAERRQKSKSSAMTACLGHIACHSASKRLNGHDDKVRKKKSDFHQNQFNAQMSPCIAWT